MSTVARSVKVLQVFALEGQFNEQLFFARFTQVGDQFGVDVKMGFGSRDAGFGSRVTR
jgi:hypothetical protein